MIRFLLFSNPERRAKNMSNTFWMAAFLSAITPKQIDFLIKYQNVDVGYKTTRMGSDKRLSYIIRYQM